MMKKVVKRLIPRQFYEPIRRFFFIKHLKDRIEKIRNTDGFCIVFISTPLHGNLGDHAIVYSQERFFTDRGLKKHIIEIPSPQYQNYSLEIKKLIMENDLIIIDGGGSMGTLWINVEHKMQHIVKNFPENPIFIFPQTIYYSKDSYGDEEMQKSIKIYSSHNNLHICAREKASYDLMKEIYPTVNILLIPDIVLYLNINQRRILRNGVVYCLRADKERFLSNESIEQIKNEVKHRGLQTSYESTVLLNNVPRKKRLTMLNKKWDKFSSAQLVITDRLHGMIFAAITGTPCIAFDNSSRKVKNVYSWIKKLDYICFLEDTNNISQHIDYMLNKKDLKYDNKDLQPYYNELFQVIESCINFKK